MTKVVGVEFVRDGINQCAMGTEDDIDDKVGDLRSAGYVKGDGQDEKTYRVFEN